jgi:hypothetical protein
VAATPERWKQRQYLDPVAHLEGVEVEPGIINRGIGRDRKRAPVIAAIPDYDLHRTAVPLSSRPGDVGMECTTAREGTDGRDAISQRAPAPLGLARELLGDLYAESDTGSGEEIPAVHAAKIDSPGCGPNCHLASLRNRQRNSQRAHEIVGCAEGNDGERKTGSHQSLHYSVQGAVATADYHPVDVTAVPPDQIGPALLPARFLSYQLQTKSRQPPPHLRRLLPSSAGMGIYDEQGPRSHAGM